MTGEERARQWKDPDGREGAPDDHPSGRMRLQATVHNGIRSALLAGLVTVATFAELGGGGGTDISKAL